MKTPSRTFRIAGAAALLVSLLAAMVAPVSAQTGIPGTPGGDMDFETSSPSFSAGVNTIYYPWVANNDDFGLGEADTSISVQNLEDRDAQIWIYVGDGSGGFSLSTTAFLSRYASKTFTAEQLDIAEGEGAPVAVRAFHQTGPIDSEDLIETEVTLIHNELVDDVVVPVEVTVCVVNTVVTSNDEDGVTYADPAPFVAALDFTYNGVAYAQGDSVPWTDQAELQNILDQVNAGNAGTLVNPFGGLNQDGDCLDAIMLVEGASTFLDSVAIGGVAKAAVGGQDLPMTSAADTAVSGYNALSGWEVFRFDEWYLPIVQTNCGPGGCWDSMIRVANVGAVNNAVTIRFFPANDGSGSLQTGFQVHELVHGGDTWNVNLSDLVPEGWVGSAHVYSDGAVYAMVDRYKVGYNMWLTNTGSSADFENLAQVPGDDGDYVLFAPHVLIDYFGWNTGINVANLADEDNNVSIQYYNLLGNSTEGQNQRLAPHGMTYFYDPSQAPQDNNDQDPVTDANAGIVGSALIWSDHPVAAVVDATKYPESDPSGGVDLFQGTTYSATANVFTAQAVPLVQKGNPTDGMGSTSGINIMNPNAEAAVANVYWVNQSGFQADNLGISSVSIPAFANGFVYTLTQHNLPNGFYGAAQVIANVPVVAVSANVDYQVDGDGSVIFNAYNPCGLYRTAGLTELLDENGLPVLDEDGDPVLVSECSFGDPFDTSGGSVTKTFTDAAGNPIPGVGFSIVGQNAAFPFQRDGFSGTDGSATFTNVPVGDYELVVTSVPDDFLLPVYDPENPELFTVNQGEDVTLSNTLEFAQGFTKTVTVLGANVPTTVSGIDVVVFAGGGTDGTGGMVAGDVVFEGLTGVGGSVGAGLPAGDYILCIFDADGTATTSEGETVTPALPTEPDLAGDNCEVFTVVTDETIDLVNPITFDEQETATLVVTGDNVADQGFEDLHTGVASTSFVEGPAGQPLGEGSLQVEVGQDGNGGVQFGLNSFEGVRLASLTELRYSAFIQDRPAGSCGAVNLIIRLDLDADGVQDESLTFEPCYQTDA